MFTAIINIIGVLDRKLLYRSKIVTRNINFEENHTMIIKMSLQWVTFIEKFDYQYNSKQLPSKLFLTRSNKWLVIDITN